MFIVSRKVADEDYVKLNQRGRKFILRHKETYPKIFKFIELDFSWGELSAEIDCCASGGFSNDAEDARYLSSLLVSIFRRAVGDRSATHIAWGNIGHSE